MSTLVDKTKITFPFTHTFWAKYEQSPWVFWPKQFNFLLPHMHDLFFFNHQHQYCVGPFRVSLLGHEYTVICHMTQYLLWRTSCLATADVRCWIQFSLDLVLSSPASAAIKYMAFQAASFYMGAGLSIFPWLTSFFCQLQCFHTLTCKCRCHSFWINVVYLCICNSQ